MSDKHLRTWLDDHLALATGAAELARRTRNQNRAAPMAATLEGIAERLDEHRDAIKDVLASLDASPSRVKQAAGWLAEKIGRVRLNERLLSYTPLSRLEELEALLLASASLGVMWRSVERVRGEHAAFQKVDVTRMAEGAEALLDEVRGLIGEAADEALAPA